MYVKFQQIYIRLYKGTDDIALTSLHSHIADMDRRHCTAILPTWTDVIAQLQTTWTDIIAQLHCRQCTARSNRFFEVRMTLDRTDKHSHRQSGQAVLLHAAASRLLAMGSPRGKALRSCRI